MARHIRVLVLPSDGTPPHPIHLKTVLLEPTAPNPLLGHHPDLHRYWGPTGWSHRHATPLRIQSGRFEGKYYLFRSLAQGHLEVNRHVGGYCFGDAFVVRVLEDGGDGRGDAGFVDVPGGLGGEGGRGVLGEMVRRLGEAVEV